jgi:hypothetical protein
MIQRKMIEKKMSSAINGTTNDYTSSVFDYGLLWLHDGITKGGLARGFCPRSSLG